MSGLNVDTLIDLHQRQGRGVELEITDTFRNITGNDAYDQFDGFGGNTYLLQKLKPGVSYKLTFSIFMQTSTNSVWEELAGNITATDVHSSSTLGTTPVEGNYFFYTENNIEYVAFKTQNPDDLITVNATKMTRHDTDIELYRPINGAAYTNFASQPSFYELSSLTKQPTNGFAVDPIKHAYDGYLFLFYHENTSYSTKEVANTNAALTNALINGDFIGYKSGDNLKGFKRISDIHASRTDGVEEVKVNFTTADFQPGPPVGVFGQTLEKNGKYIIGLVLHDKDSDYIPYEYASSGKVIKFYSTVLNAAGNWQIFLKNFVNVTTHHDHLHPSTAAGIHIDSISTVGDFNSNDSIRIVMKATPFTPLPS